MKIGIYNQEIFIERNGGGCDVLRVVTKDTLSKMRTADGLIDYGYDYYWKESVMADQTELGLYDWLGECLDEIDMDDEESFVGKDEGALHELTKEEREIADKYIEETYGIEVGTWECSGWYMPQGEYEIVLREE